MDTPEPNPNPAIAAYVKELSVSSVVSYSHYTLAALYEVYGEEQVNMWLDEYWRALREYHS